MHRSLSPTNIETIPTNHNKTTFDDMTNCNNDGNIRKQRRVHFSVNDENDSRSAPHQELTAEMINDMWYTPQNIDSFKENAKYAIVNQAKLSQMDDNEEFSMSGLERYGRQRTEYKRSALYYTLDAQRKTRNPDFIRSVARRCTAWARSVAAQQGFEDYCDVYDPLSRLLADPTFSVEILKAVNKSQGMAEKRSLGELDEELPLGNKRQRVL